EGAPELGGDAGDPAAPGADQVLCREETATQVVGPDGPTGKLARRAVDEDERITLQHHLKKWLQRQHAETGKYDGTVVTLIRETVDLLQFEGFVFVVVKDVHRGLGRGHDFLHAGRNSGRTFVEIWQKQGD